jgi:hypothetical protein
VALWCIDYRCFPNVHNIEMKSVNYVHILWNLSIETDFFFVLDLRLIDMLQFRETIVKCVLVSCLRRLIFLLGEPIS